MKTDIKSMLPDEIAERFESMGEKRYRAKQVFRWLHKGAASFFDMTDLPETLRIELDDAFFITRPEMLEKRIAKTEGTAKYLWGLGDGNCVESVLMQYDHGLTICVSTQAGCRMGCVFCASAIGGLKRNLAPSEMLDQALHSQLDAGNRISNVVLMGIGEPLDNFENVRKFISIINHPEGLNIGARHITVSTCGLIENIDKLAMFDIQLSLAVSLHAPDDETRSRLMPVNKTSGVDELIDACERFFETTGRRVTYEYALIDGVNDTALQAEILSNKLRGSGSHINLIMLSQVPQREYRPSPPERVKEFTDILRKNGMNFTLRRKLGADIEASCGQLRASKGHTGNGEQGIGNEVLSIYGALGDNRLREG